MTTTVRSAAGSDIGQRRAGNQDSAYTSPRLLAVADGMGGHAHGEVASTLAIRVIAETDARLDGVDLQTIDLLATLRATPLQRLRMVHLPSALPSILTGMEVGIVLATIGAILGEYLSASGGTGYASASTGTCTTATTSCPVTGLTNGITYTVTVTVGPSPAAL